MLLEVEEVEEVVVELVLLMEVVEEEVELVLQMEVEAEEGYQTRREGEEEVVEVEEH